MNESKAADDGENEFNEAGTLEQNVALDEPALAIVEEEVFKDETTVKQVELDDEKENRSQKEDEMKITKKHGETMLAENSNRQMYKTDEESTSHGSHKVQHGVFQVKRPKRIKKEFSEVTSCVGKRKIPKVNYNKINIIH